MAYIIRYHFNDTTFYVARKRTAGSDMNRLTTNLNSAELVGTINSAKGVISSLKYRWLHSRFGHPDPSPCFEIIPVTLSLGEPEVRHTW